MSTPLLATKLYLPPLRPNVVLRPRLVERLHAGLHRKLTLISAPAGFGKTTLLSAWVAGCARPTAWLSLDAGDADPTRFLLYLVAALQTVAPTIGEGILRVLQSPQPPPIDAILTALLNDIAALPDPFILVLDDYHAIDAQPVDQALTFLVEHLPPQLHLVIATREDPPLPLARFRARGQLTELRATDLRFTPAEAADFLNHVMGCAFQRTTSPLWKPAPKAGLPACNWQPSPCTGDQTLLILSRRSPAATVLCWTIWLKRCSSISPRPSSSSCCTHRSSIVSAGRCVMRFSATLSARGRRPFTPSSAPICFSSHLMVSDTGIVTTISLASSAAAPRAGCEPGRGDTHRAPRSGERLV